jgi:phage replication-related protein YjqB (UPF0714/DUF867 family)
MIFEVWNFGKNSRQGFVHWWGKDREYAMMIRKEIQSAGFSSALSWGKFRIFRSEKEWGIG